MRAPRDCHDQRGDRLFSCYPDGQHISRGEMLEVVGRIARAVRIPVTADLEAGYGTIVKDMAETVKAAIEAGAIGMNLEDVTGDEERSQVALPLQVEKIRRRPRDGEITRCSFRVERSHRRFF